jgi:hypothetical protein
MKQQSETQITRVYGTQEFLSKFGITGESLGMIALEPVGQDVSDGPQHIILTTRVTQQ